MFMYSRKDSIKLIGWTLAINAFIAMIISVFWPLYWTKAFLFTYVGTAIGGGGKLATLIEQLKYMIIMFTAIFVIIVIAAAKALKKLYAGNRRLQSIRIQENDFLHTMSLIMSIIYLRICGLNRKNLNLVIMPLFMILRLLPRMRMK